MYIKIITDSETNVYIDNELVSTVSANTISKIPIEKGEYLIKYACCDLPELYIERIVFIEYDKVECISFNSEIQKQKGLIVSRELIPKQNKEGHFGFVIKGTSLWGIPPTYEKVQSFTCEFIGDVELAVVQKDGSYSIINKRNEVLIPWGKFKEINFYTSFYFGTDLFDNHWVISKEGIPIYKGLNSIDELYDKVIAWKNFIMVKNEYNGKWKGLFFDNTPIGLLEEFDSAEPIDFCYDEGYYLIENDGMAGLSIINNATKTSKWIIPCAREYNLEERYSDHERRFRDTVLEICFYNSIEEKKYSYSYYPYKGVFVETKYNPHQGKKEKDVIKIYDNDERLLFEGTNIDLSYFWGDWALFNKDGKEYAINTNGKVIGPFCFVGGYFRGYAEIIQNGKHGLINENGEIVIPCQYDSMDWGSRYKEFYYHEGYVESNYFVIVGQDRGICGLNSGVYGIMERRLLVPTEYQQIDIKKVFFCCKSTLVSISLAKAFESWTIYNLNGDRIDSLSTEEDAAVFMAWQDICEGVKKTYALGNNSITEETYDKNISRIKEKFIRYIV